MNGVLTYKKYLENVENSVEYEIPVSNKAIKSLLEKAKDINEIFYLNKVVSKQGDIHFIKNKDFINTEIKFESKLSKYIDVQDLFRIIDADAVCELDDAIIDCCGDLLENSEYKNIGLDSNSFGVDDATGEEKIRELQGSINSVKTVIDSLIGKNAGVSEEEFTENVDESEEDVSILKKYSQREEEEDYDDEDFDFNEEDYYEEEATKKEGIAGLLHDLNIFGSEKIEIKKGEKLVDSKHVTAADDALAKTLIAINAGMMQLPKATKTAIGAVKEESKKAYEAMKVEDEEVEEE